MTVFLIIFFAMMLLAVPAYLKVYPDVVPDWLKVVFLTFGSLFRLLIAVAGILIVFGVLVAVLG